MKNQAKLFKTKKKKTHFQSYFDKKNLNTIQIISISYNNLKIDFKTHNQPKTKIIFGLKYTILGKFKRKQHLG
jgi:hypothetical protein